MLALAHATPLATGRLRLVFRHPDAPHLLVKTIRRDVADARTDRRWYKRLARTGPYALYLREIREYLAARARHPAAAVPLVSVVGLVETDLGLGLVQEAIRADDGALAPTLASLLRAHGRVPWLESALADFMAALLRHDVIVGDLHPGNVVYGHDSHGGPRLVLVDGFGEKNVIPYCSWSATLNARHTRQRYAVLQAKIARLLAERSATPGV